MLSDVGEGNSLMFTRLLQWQQWRELFTNVDSFS